MALSKEEMILKQMTGNIDEPLLIVIDEAICFSFDSYARGYHAYMNIWNPADGEILVCTRETDNSHDTYAVSIMRNSYDVGHAPWSLSKAFSNFLSLPGSTILCTVTGKKVNRGAGLGLEIPVTYQARGHVKALKWLEQVTKKILTHATDLSIKFQT